MKKIFGTFAVAAMIFATASCQKEQLVAPGQGGDGLVTFTIELPEALQTKSVIGEDGIADGKVYYEVWSKDYGQQLIPYGGAETPYVELTDNKATLELRLVSDQTYEFVFWAQHADCDIYDVAELTAVGIDYGTADNGNLANRDAFCNTKQVTVVGSKKETVYLYRPFAQLNFGADDMATDLGEITLGNTEITVKGLATGYNVVTKATTGSEDVVFYGNSLVDDGTLDANGKTDYAYLSMNYLLPANREDNVDIIANFTTQFGVVNHEFVDVPVWSNYRTNIVGKIFTSETEIEIEVLPGYDDDNDLEVMDSGIVKNIDGAYDITTASGLAYAINNLFADGGVFYILEDIDMTDYPYTPATLPAGVTVNLYGTQHVVTKAATAVGPVTISGMTQPMINTVSRGANVIFENINLATEAAFVEANEGTVSFENCTNAKDADDNDGTDELIGTNNGSAGNVQEITTAEALTETLADGGFVKFADDITQNETQTNGYGVTGFVHNGQVIDGNSFELTVTGANGTWDSAIYTNGGTIKNLTVAGAMRGIFMGAATADLYIDNVVFEDVVYTFNSDGGSRDYGVYISNTTLNGWTSFSDVHKEVVFTNCKFAEGSGYAFCRPYNKASFVNCDFAAGFQIDARAKITFENCTIAGEALTEANLATLVTYNTENAKVVVYADSYESLVEALAAGQSNTITLKSAIAAPAGESVLDLGGKTIEAPASSAIVVNAGSTLTLKNANVTAYESPIRAIGGSVVIESGEYTQTGSAVGSPATYRYALDCRADDEGNLGSITVNGGEFSSGNGLINAGGNVTINGGSFTNIVEKVTTRHMIYVNGNANLTINDGEFKAVANSSAGGECICIYTKTGTVTIAGGKFTSLWSSGSANAIVSFYTSGSTLNVTGGIFNTNKGISSYVTENTDDATKVDYPYMSK